MNNKTILITGATGLLGINLIPSLLSNKFNLICLYRTKKSIECLTHYKNINFLSYKEFFSSNFKLKNRIDVVLHCAGFVSYKKADASQLFEVNEGLTKQLAEYALNSKVCQFIYISSIAALDKNQKFRVVTENTASDNKTFKSNYGKSKEAGELALKELKKKGLKWTILSPSVILAPGPIDKSSAKLIGYVLDEKPFYTTGTINFVDVRDLSAIIIRCILAPKWYETIIISGGHTTYKRFFQTFAIALNRRVPFIKIPNWALLIGAILENIWSKLLNQKPLLSTETAKMAGQNFIYSNAKSKELFQYDYYSLEESLQYLKEEKTKI